jgi:hypothetical protein
MHVKQEEGRERRLRLASNAVLVPDEQKAFSGELHDAVQAQKAMRQNIFPSPRRTFYMQLYLLRVSRSAAAGACE